MLSDLRASTALPTCSMNTNPSCRNGTNGDERIIGTDGNDEIHGNGGLDAVEGNDGNDRIFGEAGEDHLFGRGDDDRISGGDGNDEIQGADGNDDITGGDGMRRHHRRQDADGSTAALATTRSTPSAAAPTRSTAAPAATASSATRTTRSRTAKSFSTAESLPREPTGDSNPRPLHYEGARGGKRGASGNLCTEAGGSTKSTRIDVRPRASFSPGTDDWR